jgi:hypothetical protein
MEKKQGQVKKEYRSRFRVLDAQMGARGGGDGAQSTIHIRYQQLPLSCQTPGGNIIEKGEKS